MNATIKYQQRLMNNQERKVKQKKGGTQHTKGSPQKNFKKK